MMPGGGIGPYREHLFDRRPHARAHAITNTTKPAVTGLTKSLRFDYAGTGVVSSAACPACVARAIFGKSVHGRSSPDQKVPESVYPWTGPPPSSSLGFGTERIIVVPETPYTDLWKGCVLGDGAGEGFRRVDGAAPERGGRPGKDAYQRARAPVLRPAFPVPGNDGSTGSGSARRAPLRPSSAGPRGRRSRTKRPRSRPSRRGGAVPRA